MIFFTRALYDGIQDGSDWGRRAERTWDRNRHIYHTYLKAISPLLPRSVIRLCRKTLHDAFVESVAQRAGSLTFTLDARGALGGFRGRRVQLTFSGARRRVSTTGLAGGWWLYEEAHLSSRAAFALHVMLDRCEFEIEADALDIKYLPQGLKQNSPAMANPPVERISGQSITCFR